MQEPKNKDYQLAVSYLSIDELDLALKPLEKAAEENYPPAFLRLAVIYRYRDDKEKFKSYLDQVLKLQHWFKKQAKTGSAEDLYHLAIFYNLKNKENKAVKYYQLAAEQDNIFALYMLGICYLSGLLGIEKNKQLGFDYCKKAADLNHPMAQYDVSLMYKQGTEIQKNEAQHLHYLELAANNGVSVAQNLLGAHHLGTGNLQEAIKCYTQAAEKNDPMAIYNLGTLYYQADDFKMAEKQYERAAQLGWPLACSALSIMYREGRRGVLPDQYKAEEYKKKAKECEAKAHSTPNCSISQFHQGRSYLEKGDLDNALKSFKASAKQGNPYAQVNVGYLYLNARLKNEKKAEKYFRLAAAKDVPEAYFNLGVLHEKKGDYIAALKYYINATEKKFSAALFRIGVLHSTGKYAPLVMKDSLMAHHYFEKIIQENPVKTWEELYQFILNEIKILTENSDETLIAFKECILSFLTDKARSLTIAQYYLGRFYLEGIFISDVNRGENYLTLAADAGNSDAQITLATVYQKGHSLNKDDKGEKIKSDNYKALKYFHMSALKGNFKCWYHIAKILSELSPLIPDQLPPTLKKQINEQIKDHGENEKTFILIGQYFCYNQALTIVERLIALQNNTDTSWIQYKSELVFNINRLKPQVESHLQENLIGHQESLWNTTRRNLEPEPGIVQQFNYPSSEPKPNTNI